MLSALAPMGLGDVQRHRLRATLLQITDPADLAVRLRDRATVTLWSGHRSVNDRIRQDLVVPGRGAGLLDVARRRFLLSLLVRKELRVRYRASVLGLGWSYVKPGVQYVVYFLALGVFLRLREAIPDFAVYLFAGMITVNLFSEALANATRSVVNNADLVKKIYLPRELFPVASVWVAIVHFAPQLLVLLVGAVVAGWRPQLLSLLGAVAGFIIVVTLATGLGLLFSALNALFRDLENLVDLLLMVAVWISPVLYSWRQVAAVPFVAENSWLLTLYQLNPVTVAVELVLGFALALVMVKALSSIRPVIRAAILIPYAVITVVSAFAWQFAFSLDSGFVNNWFSFLGLAPDTDWFGSPGSAIFVICLAEIWKTTPFISLLLLAGLAQVPEVLQEAARVDGATWWQRMTKVTIPNMKAAIMVALLFRSLDAFRVFDSIFVMTGGANSTESVSFLAYRQTIARLEIGLGSAVSVLLFLCVVFISFVFIKVFKVDLGSTRGDS